MNGDFVFHRRQARNAVISPLEYIRSWLVFGHLSQTKVSWCITSVLSISELPMSLWKWMRHGRRQCISVYFWEGSGAVLSPSSCCWLFTHIVKDWGQGSTVVRSPLHHPSGLIGGVRYPVAWPGGIGHPLPIMRRLHAAQPQRILSTSEPITGSVILGPSTFWGSSVAENTQPLWTWWVVND